MQMENMYPNHARLSGRKVLKKSTEWRDIDANRVGTKPTMVEIAKAIGDSLGGLSDKYTVVSNSRDCLLTHLDELIRAGNLSKN